MDWSFWGHGLLAIVVAVLLSSVELLTKYDNRSPREIFLSPYYAWFALINAVFCFLVYWVLPHISAAVFKAELPFQVDDGLGRALTAGLGYLVIARLSILDITTKAGETYGAGFDGIYNAVAQYVLRRHNAELRSRMRNDFYEVFDEAPPKAFTKAARLLGTELEGAERTGYDERLKLALAAPDDRPAEQCLALYQLIRDHTIGKEDAHKLIEQQASSLS